ncbi:MAG: transketolase [Oscillospiraceae bacterium]|jgi:transketolase|nr:transketolase [Oscillospiraceae bacterium]
MDTAVKKQLKAMACRVRMGVVEGVYNAKSGHPGGSLGLADTLTYLYMMRMNVDPENPGNPERDRFVLSKGHNAPVLYSVLAYSGFFPVDELKTLRKIGSRLQGHPVMGTVPGVDMSTGSLGQGFSAACGMALAGKTDRAGYRVYAVLGDGEIQEGQVWEAAMFASHYGLDNLTAIVDNNNLQIDGKVSDIMSVYPIDEKFRAFGWHTVCIDGHDFDRIEQAFEDAEKTSGKPTVIIQKTVKGKGVSFMENAANWHGMAPNQEQYEMAMSELAECLKQLED